MSENETKQIQENKYFRYEYIWLDGTGNQLKSKTKICQANIENIEDWSCDGNSCQFSECSPQFSEVILRPKRVIRDPFNRNEFSFLVLCETLIQNVTDNTQQLVQTSSNFRNLAEQTHNAEYLYGIEQEFFLFNSSLQESREVNYCSVTINQNVRNVLDEMVNCCLYSEIKISGYNAEVSTSQYEYQIGPLDMLEICDQLWLSRYILMRIAEKHTFQLCFDPKPFPDQNGSGCHINISNLNSRNNLESIQPLLDRLEQTHSLILPFLGTNDERLKKNKQFEVPDANIFSYGVGNRLATCRIPVSCFIANKGYVELRTPASDINPYLALPCIYLAMTSDVSVILSLIPIISVRIARLTHI